MATDKDYNKIIELLDEISTTIKYPALKNHEKYLLQDVRNVRKLVNQLRKTSTCPTDAEIEAFASKTRSDEWSVEIDNSAVNYERGIVFGAKWIKKIWNTR